MGNPILLLSSYRDCRRVRDMFLRTHLDHDLELGPPDRSHSPLLTFFCGVVGADAAAVVSPPPPPYSIWPTVIAWKKKTSSWTGNQYISAGARMIAQPAGVLGFRLPYRTFRLSIARQTGRYCEINPPALWDPRICVPPNELLLLELKSHNPNPPISTSAHVSCFVKVFKYAPLFFFGAG